MKRTPLLLLALGLLFSQFAAAQTPIPFEKGTVWSGSYHGGDVDAVNLQSGSLSFKIPIYSLPQKGKLALSYSLVFNSNNLRTNQYCEIDGFGQTYCAPYASVAGPIDPQLVIDQSLDVPYTQPPAQSGSLFPCELNSGCPVYGNFSQTYYLEESDGARHQLMPNPGNHNTLYPIDGSGYLVNANGFMAEDWNACPPGQAKFYSTASLVTPGGITHDWSKNTNCISRANLPPATIHDRFGNRMLFQYDGQSTQDMGGLPHSPVGTVLDSIDRTIPAFPTTLLGNANGCPNLGIANQVAVDSKEWVVPGPNANPGSPSTPTVTYRFCYTTITYNSNEMLACVPSHCFPGGPVGAAIVLQSVVLPTGAFWGFVYDSAGMYSGNPAQDYSLLPEHHPDLIRLIYPTGGTIDYTYQGTNACNWGQGITHDQRYVASRRLSGTSAGWSYQYNVGVSKVTDPDGNDTVHYYEDHGDPCFVGIENQIERYQGSSAPGYGQLMESTFIQHANATDLLGVSGKYTINTMPSATTVQRASGAVVTTTFEYPTLRTAVNIACALWTTVNFFNGGCAEAGIYDLKFANATRTVTADSLGQTSTVLSNFEWQDPFSSAGALAANDLMLPQYSCLMPGNTTVCTSPASAARYNSYTYDSSGKQLTSKVYDSLHGTDAITSYTYTSGGRVHTTTDPNGNTTTTDYDSYDLFPVKITRPATSSTVHAGYYQYDLNTGNLRAQVDENGTGIGDTAHRSDYTYDSAGRLIDAQGPPVNGQRSETKICYSDTGGGLGGICSAGGAPFSVYTRVYASPSPDQNSHIDLDGFGRTVHAIAANNAVVDTTYDDLGRVHSVSNPHFTTPSSTDGTTTFAYDALGRKTSQTNPDATTATSSYNGNAVTTTDESLKKWTRVSDGLGRLTDVYEDPLGLNLHTSYTYDVLGNLLTVNQVGVSGEAARNRSFTYDSLSRLITSTNPETGTICYGTWNSGNCVGGYDNNGNLKHKTDARNITTSYTYDALNRLTLKTYSDGTPSVGYGYDGKDASGATLSPLPANPVGRLTHATGQTNVGSKFSYDPLGRLKEQRYCVPQECSYGIAVSADYDLAGNQIKLTYPDGRRVATEYDPVGRLSRVSFDAWGGSPVNSSYLSVNSTGGYDPAGHLVDATMGNGVHVGASYNNRLQLSSLAYTKDSASLWSKNLTWLPNGNLQKQTDPSAGIERQFTYDSLNRLTGALDVVGSASGTGTAVSSLPSGSPSNSSTNVLPNANTIWGSNWDKWQVNVTDNGTAAPDGSMTATVLTAQGGATDAHISGHLGSSAGVYTYTAITGSVWLRSPGGSRTLNLYLIDNFAWGNIPVYKQVTVTPTWQQFEITETAHNDLVDMQFQIGGAGSYTSGELDVWGARLEPSPSVGDTITNFLPYSQRLTATNWGINHATVTDNNADAPDGTHTAATLAGNATDAFADGYVPTPAPYSGTAVTGSVYLRVASGTKTFNIYVVEVGDMGWQALAAQTVTATTAWQRFQLSGTTQNALTQLVLQVGGSNSLNAGDTIQVWGAQMELGSVMNPYVATGSSSASRGANFTNLLAYSQRVYGAPWQMGNGTASNNSADAPDGTHTAMTVTPNSGSGDTYIYNEAPYAGMYGASKLTASVYLRVPSGTLSTNLFLINNFGVKKAQPITLTTTWQRFSVTDTAINGLTQLALQVGGGGTVVSGQPFQMWGAQMEAAASVGPYVRTEAVPVTAGGEFVNLLPFSQQPNGPTWWYSIGDTVAVNAATAPDGTSTAATVTHGNSGDTWVFNQAPNPALYAGSTVTGSVYLRSPGGIRTINLTLVNGGPGGLNNASQTLTLTTNWQRFQITKSLQSDLNFLGLTIGGGQSMTSGSIEVWGAQIVNGTEAGTYDPTSGGNPGIAIGQAGAPVPNGIFQSYSYDSFGNLKQSGSFNFWQSYNERNRLNGYLYDAAGNLLSDGVTNVMAWDAESRLKSVGGATYAYDAEGNRVESAGATITDTIYFGGKPLARYAAGQWTDLIYGPTGLLAETHGPELTSPQYRLLDHLGTQVATADAYGARSSITDYAPFGQIFAGGSNDPYKFTGKERDPESGLDYFGARYYASGMGRWMSPDWAEKPEAVPYSDLADPQSLNLYGYVRNNPVDRADADGHCIPWCVVALVQGYQWAGDKIYQGLHEFVKQGAQAMSDPTGRSQILMGMGIMAESTMPVPDMEDAPALGTLRRGTVPAATEETLVLTEEVQNIRPREPYNRKLHYGHTPTAADRAAIGGESVDHDPPLVQRYYEGDPARGEKPGHLQTSAERKASANDRSRMKPSTLAAQHEQGGAMARYSREQKKKHGLD